MKKKVLIVGFIAFLLLASKVYACCLDSTRGNHVQTQYGNPYYEETNDNTNRNCPNCDNHVYHQPCPYREQVVEHNYHHANHGGHHGWHH